MNDNISEVSLEHEVAAQASDKDAVGSVDKDEQTGEVTAQLSGGKEVVVEEPAGLALSNLELTKPAPKSVDTDAPPTPIESFRDNEYRQKATIAARNMDNDIKYLISRSREARGSKAVGEDLVPDDLEGVLIRKNDVFQKQLADATSEFAVKDAILEFTRWFKKTLTGILDSEATRLNNSYQDRIATYQIIPQVNAYKAIRDNLDKLTGIAIRIERESSPTRPKPTVEPAITSEQSAEDVSQPADVTDAETAPDPDSTVEPDAAPDNAPETLSPTPEPEPSVDTPVEITAPDGTPEPVTPVEPEVTDSVPEPQPSAPEPEPSVDAPVEITAPDETPEAGPAVSPDAETAPDPAAPIEPETIALKPLEEIKDAAEFSGYLNDLYNNLEKVVAGQLGEIDKLKAEPVNLTNMDKWRPIVDQLKSITGAIDALTPYMNKFDGDGATKLDIVEKYLDLLDLRKKVNTLIVEDLRTTSLGEALGAKSTQDAVKGLQDQVDKMPAGTPAEQETKEAQQERLDAIKAQIEGSNETPSALEKFAGITFKEFAEWNSGSDVGTFLSFLLDPVSARGRNGEKLSFGKYNEVDAENVILHEFRAKIKEPSLVGLALYKTKDSFQNIILKSETKEKMDKLRNESTPKLVKEVLMDIYNDHLKTDATGDKWKEFRLHFTTQLFGGETKKYMDSKSASFLLELLKDDGKQLDSFWKIQ